MLRAILALLILLKEVSVMASGGVSNRNVLDKRRSGDVRERVKRSDDEKGKDE
jgi:hypothetical protein